MTSCLDCGLTDCGWPCEDCGSKRVRSEHPPLHPRESWARPGEDMWTGEWLV